jgi:GlpG protein
MRQIGTLASETDARRLADYLLTHKVATQLLKEPEGWSVWVCDEDRVALAKQEFAEFTRHPADPRYQAAARAAQAVRKEEARAEKKYRRNLIDVRERWGRASVRYWPVTFGLIAVSVLVGILTNLGRIDTPVRAWLTFAPYTLPGDGYIVYQEPSLQTVADFLQHGQVWRLVTPIFIHFTVLHLVFNMMWLYDLGRQIEFRRGSWRLGLLVLVIAVTSNLAQYLASTPFFGGMSGVVFGLFGYIWMKARFDPEAGLYMHPNTILLLLFWGLICTTGILDRVVGPIANWAHGVGLVTGMVIGLASSGWSELRRGG